MSIRKIGTDMVAVLNKQNTDIDVIWTDGVGDCIVLALLGRNKSTRIVEILFAHLSSKAYSPPVYGGKTDMPVSTTVRKFVKEHDEISALSATNYVHNLAVGHYMVVRFGLSETPAVHFLGRKRNADVSLHVADFTMHACKPGEIAADNNVLLFQTTGGQGTDTANAARVNRKCIECVIL